MEHLYDNLELFKIGELNVSAFTSEHINSKQSIVVLESEDYKKNLEFLQKVLPAINFGDSGILVIDQSKSDYFPLSSLMHPVNKSVLVFGIDPQTLGLPKHLSKHKLYRLEKFDLSFTVSLSQMIEQAELKKIFWGFAKSNFVKSN